MQLIKRSFFCKLRSLPKEVRDNIYAQVADLHDNEVKTEHTTSEIFLKEGFSGEESVGIRWSFMKLKLRTSPKRIRGSPAKIFPKLVESPTIQDSIPLVWAGLLNDHNTSELMSDSDTVSSTNVDLAPCRYYLIIQFVYSLALHEDFQFDSTRNRWHSSAKSWYILGEFLEWFWTKFGLFVRQTWHDVCYQCLCVKIMTN